MTAPDYRYATSFRQAKHYHSGRVRKVRLLVLHSAETGELPSSAEGVQAYFVKVVRPASAHLTWDSDSCAQSVKLGDTAFGAAKANADGVHFEHAGMARQSRDQWMDDFGEDMLLRSAVGAAEVVTRFHLAPKFLTAKMLQNPAATGITTHAEISKAWPSNGHWDPGPGFPIDWYMARVADALAGRLTMTLVAGKLVIGSGAAPKPVEVWARVLKPTNPPMHGADVEAVQRVLHLPVTGSYDLFTATAVAGWKAAVFGTKADDPQAELVGAFSAKKMGLV